MGWACWWVGTYGVSVAQGLDVEESEEALVFEKFEGRDFACLKDNNYSFSEDAGFWWIGSGWGFVTFYDFAEDARCCHYCL